MSEYMVMKTSIGNLKISSEYSKVCKIALTEEDELHPDTPLLFKVCSEIRRYLNGELKEFTFPIKLGGLTVFKKEVLYQTMQIPYGEVRTYGQIAHASGSPDASRAVGSHMRENPLLLVVPCHRVVPVSGGIGNYVGGADIKRYLLRLEEQSGRNIL